MSGPQRPRVPPSDILPSGLAEMTPTRRTVYLLAPLLALTLAGAAAAAEDPSNSKKELADRHWAFQPIRKPEPPPGPADSSAHPIDRFVAAKYREKGVEPVATADRRTLLRRVTFDLTGLPPTREEIAEFLSDESPGAFARVVERLLASPRYGERWGRHWMDVVRYADTAGDNADYPVPEAALYRDYIIRAFNSDKPFDAFVREQLAGDLLAKESPAADYAELIAATTFVALSRRYLTAPYEQHHLTIEDTIETTGRAFLGLTLRCARCHDHKFDPITTEDYYAIYGIFASTQYPYAGSEEFASMQRPRESFVPIVAGEQMAARLAGHRVMIKQLRETLATLEKEHPLARQLAELNGRIGALEAPPKDAAPPAKESLDAIKKERDQVKSQFDQKLKPIRDELRSLSLSSLPGGVPGAYAVTEGPAADVAVQLAGDPGRPGSVVHRGPPRFLARVATPNIPDGSSGRLELAHWITDPSNPLTARVIVNRIWQHHFGRGLVATASNFGLSGESPSHAELLDWLAATLIENGWSIKAMHRIILSSNTYQLASVESAEPRRDSAGPSSLGADEANESVWHFPRRRLDAEAIRDALLFVSGNLDLAGPGSHPFPEMTAWNWTQHNPFKDVYASNHRSVYLMTQRLQRHPFFAIFDGPDTNSTTESRSTSTVPLQALFFLNNPFLQQQASSFARRLIAEATEPADRVRLAFEMAFGRLPADAELVSVLGHATRLGAELREVPGVENVEVETWTSIARTVLASNEFVYVD
jgi:hypothetical protein